MTEKEAVKNKQINYEKTREFNRKYNFIVDVMSQYWQKGIDREENKHYAVTEHFVNISHAGWYYDPIKFRIYCFYNRKKKAENIQKLFGIEPVKDINYKKQELNFVISNDKFEELYALCLIMNNQNGFTL